MIKINVFLQFETNPATIFSMFRQFFRYITAFNAKIFIPA